MLNKDQLTRFAAGLRRELGRRAVAEPQSVCIGLQQFPNGSCSDASLVLITYLAEKGADHLAYHSGYVTGPDHQSHAWAEADGFYVDITGDQFEGRPAVVVTRPLDDPWFERWQDVSVVDYRSEGFQHLAAPSMLGYPSIQRSIEDHVS